VQQTCRSNRASGLESLKHSGRLASPVPCCYLIPIERITSCAVIAFSFCKLFEATTFDRNSCVRNHSQLLTAFAVSDNWYLIAGHYIRLVAQVQTRNPPRRIDRSSHLQHLGASLSRVHTAIIHNQARPTPSPLSSLALAQSGALVVCALWWSKNLAAGCPNAETMDKNLKSAAQADQRNPR
jgi:hypothetical protein